MIWHSQNREAVAEELKSQPKVGLNEFVAEQRLADYGYNTIGSRKKISKMSLFLRRLLEPASLIALAAAAIYAFAVFSFDGENVVFPINALCVLLVLIARACICSEREFDANSMVQKMKEKSLIETQVRRNRTDKSISVEKLVPGDIVTLVLGDIIPADGRLLITRAFTCDESIITGDHTPVVKDCNAVLPEDTPIEGRINMAYSGCVVCGGKAVMIVTETGSKTQTGIKYGSKAGKVSSRTPIVKSAQRLCSAAYLALALMYAALVFHFFSTQGLFTPYVHINEIVGNSAILDYIAFAATLAICIVPLGIPQSVMNFLSANAKKLMADGVKVKDFGKVETVGCTSVICTDKTSTLTTGDMSVARIWALGDIPSAVDEGFWSEEMKYLMYCATLCCDSSANRDVYDNVYFTGDSTEIAIIRAYMLSGNSLDELISKHPRVKEIPFDSNRRRMTVISEFDKYYLAVTKGAVDSILRKCVDVDADEVMRQNELLCKDGLRVIAVAVRMLVTLPEEINSHTIEKKLTFIGLIGVRDPIREGVAESVKTFSRAGIRTVMISGDHPDTAMSIANQTGIAGLRAKALTGDMLDGMSKKELSLSLDKYSVFAKMHPDNKVRLVEAWHKNGDCVLTTAGGMGDALALHRSDVSCTIEPYTTDVAINASDFVFEQSSKMNIFSMIKNGRLLRNNISKLTEYCIGCSIAQGLAMILGRFIFGTNIFDLLSLLIINTLAIWLIHPAFYSEPEGERIMEHMSRKNDGRLCEMFEKCRAFISGGFICCLSLLAYAIGAGTFVLNPTYSVYEGKTMAFAAITLGLVTQAICARSEQPFFLSKINKNVKMLVAAIILIAVAVILISVPYVNACMGFVQLSIRQWLEVLLLSVSHVIAFEYPKLYSHMRK